MRANIARLLRGGDGFDGFIYDFIIILLYRFIAPHLSMFLRSGTFAMLLMPLGGTQDAVSRTCSHIYSILTM